MWNYLISNIVSPFISCVLKLENNISLRNFSHQFIQTAFHRTCCLGWSWLSFKTTSYTFLQVLFKSSPGTFQYSSGVIFSSTVVGSPFTVSFIFFFSHILSSYPHTVTLFWSNLPFFSMWPYIPTVFFF